MSDCGFTRDTWLKKMQEIADWARDKYREGTLVYGNSQTVYPCSDKPVAFISCDRGPSRGLYDLGMRDQTKGGWTTENMYRCLPDHGFKTITSWKDLEPGDIVEMTDGVHSAPCGNGKFHIFVIKAIDYAKGTHDKWDFGSNQRIADGGTFYGRPINGGLFEWPGSKQFFRAWRPLYKEVKPKEVKVEKVSTVDSYIGTVSTEGTTFHLPEYGTYKMITSHNSSAGLTGEWVIRSFSNGGKAVKIGGGSSVNVSCKGKDLTIKAGGAHPSVYLIKIG